MSLNNTICALIEGRFTVVTDAISGMSEVVLSGQAVTPDRVDFMTRMGGIVGIATTPERCEQLGLPPILGKHQGDRSLGYHTTFDARLGITTGISSSDRARSIMVASTEDADADDVVRPGHVLPAASRPSASRSGYSLTEAAVDLARLAGIFPVVARCALLDEDGALLAGDKLDRFCEDGLLQRVWTDEVWRSSRDLPTANVVAATGDANAV
jgi:3,4-dihydroxy 2-butanone 4-phosphate synthase/GTP cyclohydrolase II